ncbi:hypothetical protein [Nocardia sp. CDC160]|uniref:hypothetical protein n=1 Tax=Nocardia sp. CDC160 TaxID=3112166 RepID=UPI002DB7C5E2|nr:hypothetical protein [Nocardia sp. CDC160]MEC3920290.1 hypothetical protein [Nocardia sp. CDC160]
MRARSTVCYSFDAVEVFLRTPQGLDAVDEISEIGGRCVVARSGGSHSSAHGFDLGEYLLQLTSHPGLWIRPVGTDGISAPTSRLGQILRVIGGGIDSRRERSDAAVPIAGNRGQRREAEPLVRDCGSEGSGAQPLGLRLIGQGRLQARTDLAQDGFAQALAPAHGQLGGLTGDSLDHFRRGVMRARSCSPESPR